MSLRRRAALLTSAVMVLAVLAVLVLARQVTAGALVTTVDDDLRDLATVAERAVGTAGPGRGRSLSELRDLERRGPGAPGSPGAPRHAPTGWSVDGPVQLLTTEGIPATTGVAALLPVTEAAAAVARSGGAAAPLFEDIEVEGTPLRVLTHPLPEGGAVQLGRAMVEVESTLRTLTVRLLTVGALLTALAAALAVVVAARITRPVTELTATAEHVARTQELDTRIAPSGDDELARLGRAFDGMLARIEQARSAQTQLIADASHELRTPLTSLRTNIDLLRSEVVLSEEDHRQLLADLGDQLARFGALVDALIELARGDVALSAAEPVDLDVLVAAVVATTRRDHPSARITVIGRRPATAAVRVVGDRDRLARAIRNLVDNAVLHGDGEVEVEVGVDVTDHHARGHARVCVRDHGSGFKPADREHALERFYRGEAARERPGSGLGLAIVAQTARAHGGWVEIADVEVTGDGAGEGAGDGHGAGAQVRLVLPIEP